MPPFSLWTFLNPRSSLIIARTMIPLSLLFSVALPCGAILSLSLLFFSCCDALHLEVALGLECPGGFVFSNSLSYWPSLLLDTPVRTHTRLHSHMLMDILWSLPVGDLIFIAAQTKKEPYIVEYTITFKVVLFFY